ncbi:MAG TPA: hypothetical protein VFC79_01420, partial [Tissierellaceae bacterium]|nr:hypothetical protein [Tissierellaceae bacterium]
FKVKDLTIYGTINHWLGDTITIDDANLQLNAAQEGARVSSGLIIFDTDNINELSKLHYDVDNRWKLDNEFIATENYIDNLIDNFPTILALGETNNTAYRGDRGKIAYVHSQAAHAPVNAQKNSDITKGEIEAKLTGNITTHSHTVTKANVGLSNVDNTSDLAKPISTLIQEALNGKLGTGATAYNSARLGGQLASKYTRKDVDEIITGIYKFSNGIKTTYKYQHPDLFTTSGFFRANIAPLSYFIQLQHPGSSDHSIQIGNSYEQDELRFRAKNKSSGYGTLHRLWHSGNSNTSSADWNARNLAASGNLDVTGNGLFTGNITAQKGTLSSLDVAGIINMSGNKVATENYVNNRVKTPVPLGAVFTDTITTVNGKTGAISKADIVALGIPAADTNTTYSEISTAEIDTGTSATLRTITARRLKYVS